MDDYLDDALQRLPSDPYPEGLTDRIMLRVVQERRKQRHRKVVGWLSTAAAAVFSGVKISFWWIERGDVFPGFSVQPVIEWVDQLWASPQETMLGSTLSFWDWTRVFASQLDWVVVIALLLLLGAGMWALHDLMLQPDRDEVLWV
jgi:hypothetical protein